MRMDQRLQTLIADVLDLDSSNVVPDLSRADTAQWDSLNHLRLITAFEEEFGVQLSLDQIVQIQSVGHLEQIILQRGDARG
jgi:acyl carrier protein